MQIDAWLVWIILGIILLIFEMFTPTLFLASLSIGAFITSIFSYLGFHMIIQGIIFCIVSIAFIIFIRPVIKNLLSSSQDGDTNIKTYIGEHAKVIQKICNKEEQGRVKIYGEEWVARSINNEDIDNDTIVKVMKIESMIAYVEKVEE